MSTLNCTFQDPFTRFLTENPLANNQWGRFQETGSNVASMQVVTPNICEASTTSARNVNIVTGISFANDQWGELTVQGTVGAYTAAAIYLRATSGNPGTSYGCSISAGTWTLQYETGTTFNTLATNASVGVLVAGDVIRFEAVGTTLTGYKNGLAVVTATDATLASGRPGIKVNPGAAVANIMFSLFRAGDFAAYTPALGVWKNQGVCIGEVSGDTPGQPNVFYETGALILTPNGDGKIFWMLFGSANGVCYAESNDGIKNWTRYGSNPVLVPTGTPGAGWNAYPRIYKNGSTYYAYVVNPDFHSMSSWTSPDRVTWTQQVAKAISPDQAWSGGASPGFIGQLNVAGKIGSTYYGYYEAYDSGLGIYPLGLATSTDLVNWTADAGNPFSTADSGNFCFKTIGTRVYGWSHRRQDGIPHFGGGNGLPSDITRHVGDSPAGPFPALLNSVIYRTTLGEGVGSTVGQVADPSIIEVNGTTYLYATYTTTGNGAPTNYRIECFTSALTLAQLIETYEGVADIPQPADVGFANQLHETATDTFTVGDTNFTQITATAGWGLPTFANGSATGTTNAVRGAVYWTAYAGGANQYCTVKYLNTAASTYIGAMVRCSTAGAATCYAATFGNAAPGVAGALILQKFVANTYTSLWQGTETLAVGDTITLSVSGKTLSVYQNANLLYSCVDTDIAAGSPGFYCYPDATPAHASISKFSAGSFSYTIGGNAGVAGATVSDGTNTYTSDSDGVYILSPETSGAAVTVTPSKASYTFTPTNAAETPTANIVDVNFTILNSSAYSVPDCRVAPAGPDSSRTVNGTKIYDVQTSSNAAVPSKDSRAAGAPVDSRVSPNIPQNSRAPGTFGPNE